LEREIQVLGIAEVMVWRSDCAIFTSIWSRLRHTAIPRAGEVRSSLLECKGLWVPVFMYGRQPRLSKSFREVARDIWHLRHTMAWPPTCVPL